MDRTETRIGRIDLDTFVLRDRARALRSDFLLGLARRLASRLRLRSRGAPGPALFESCP